MPTFREIPASTRDFLTRGVGVSNDGLPVRFTLTPMTVAVPGEDEPLEIVRCRPADGRTDYWTDQDIEKQRIVLHHTVGSVKSDVGTLVSRGRLSVAYVIAEDGTILELFDPSKWSYHVGEEASGGNTAMSATSIGIDLCNYGNLKRDGDTLLNDYGSRYCHIDETEAYVEAPLRGIQYFARFPEAQVRALARLLRTLTDRFGIPVAFLPLDQRFEWQDGPTMTAFRGICSHINFRADKWDVGPALDWAALEAALRDERQDVQVAQVVASALDEDARQQEVVVPDPVAWEPVLTAQAPSPVEQAQPPGPTPELMERLSKLARPGRRARRRSRRAAARAAEQRPR